MTNLGQTFFSDWKIISLNSEKRVLSRNSRLDCIKKKFSWLKNPLVSNLTSCQLLVFTWTILIFYFMIKDFTMSNCKVNSQNPFMLNCSFPTRNFVMWKWKKKSVGEYHHNLFKSEVVQYSPNYPNSPRALLMNAIWGRKKSIVL